ncbi:hypothetical protein NE237_026509 [Protea cynaroides]|uniref:Uncharacterized protein n=1 Tax=Protea cynaroides TaxID=273540 RepID=A0A9Q0H4D2_9MAGN|nr:hypothetical protein NE237_026509 [Protea cynaroides]
MPADQFNKSVESLTIKEKSGSDEGENVVPVNDKVAELASDVNETIAFDKSATGDTNSPSRKERWSDMADEGEEIANQIEDGEVTPAQKAQEGEENLTVSTILGSGNGINTTTWPGTVEVSFNEIGNID